MTKRSAARGGLRYHPGAPGSNHGPEGPQAVASGCPEVGRRRRNGYGGACRRRGNRAGPGPIRRHETTVSRLGFPRDRTRADDAAGAHAPSHRRTSGPGAHGVDQPLLFEYDRRSWASAKLRSTTAAVRTTAAPATGAGHVPGADAHADDSRPRWYWRRRSGRPGGAARAGRRSRDRLGHPPMRGLLSVSARSRGHVPVPGPAGAERSGAHCRHARWHRGVRQLAHRRPGRVDGHL